MACFLNTETSKLKAFVQNQLAKLKDLIPQKGKGFKSQKGGTHLNMKTLSISKNQICATPITFNDQNKIHELMQILGENSPETFFSIVASTYNVSKYFWGLIKKYPELKKKLIKNQLQKLGKIEGVNIETKSDVCVVDFNIDFFNNDEIDEDVFLVQFHINIKNPENQHIVIHSIDGEGGSDLNHFNIQNGLAYFSNKSYENTGKVFDDDEIILQNINNIMAECHNIVQNVTKKVNELYKSDGAGYIFAMKRKYDKLLLKKN